LGFRVWDIRVWVSGFRVQTFGFLKMRSIIDMAVTPHPVS